MKDGIELLMAAKRDHRDERDINSAALQSLARIDREQDRFERAVFGEGRRLHSDMPKLAAFFHVRGEVMRAAGYREDTYEPLDLPSGSVAEYEAECRRLTDLVTDIVTERLSWSLASGV